MVGAKCFRLGFKLAPHIPYQSYVGEYVYDGRSFTGMPVFRETQNKALYVFGRAEVGGHGDVFFYWQWRIGQDPYVNPASYLIWYTRKPPPTTREETTYYHYRIQQDDWPSISHNELEITCLGGCFILFYSILTNYFSFFFHLKCITHG